MERLNIKEIINNLRDELERANEIINSNNETKRIAEDSMLLSDIASSLERTEDINERIDFAMLMAASAGDIALPTINKIYELESRTELPYTEEGLVDTELVYNTIRNSTDTLEYD